jgi:hypothetical protein
MKTKKSKTKLVSEITQLEAGDSALVLKKDGGGLEILIPKLPQEGFVPHEVLIVTAIGAILSGKRADLYDKLMDLIDSVWDEVVKDEVS